jgi:hypothetical protein
MANSAIYPDVSLINSDISPGAFIVGEIVYSQGLLGGHEKAQIYLNGIPEIRGVLVVCIRYPWSRVANNYDLQNSSMIFAYYSRVGNRDHRGHFVPNFVSNFGRVPLSNEELDTISGILGIPRPNIIGARVDNDIRCNEESSNLPEFNFTIPNRVLFLRDVDDENSVIVNHSPNEIEISLMVI